ncbi:EamA family transporter [Deinococcus aquiradiocola]|uniref:EamA family transporter n=1 Tax=Deinococcus aquiradiocola TaxID=393059 RepID=UPI00166BBC00|nr:DMT family transporter [Deinococcus aquiradiocola]
MPSTAPPASPTAPAGHAASAGRGVPLALTAALGFSTLGILGKLSAQTGLPALAALPWRFGLVALLLLPFARGLPRGVQGRMLGTGLLYCLATHAYFLALGRVSAGTTSLLLYLAPAFVLLFLALGGRRPARLQLVGIAFTVAGLGLVVGLPGPGDHDPAGLLFGVLAAALYGLYLLGSERWLTGVPPLASTAFMSLSAAAYFGVTDLFTHTLRVPTGAAQWGVVLGLAFLPTLVAVPALYGAVARIGAARASVVATTEPLWTVLLAAVFLHEPLRAAVLLGGAGILLGAVLAQLSAGRAAPLEL